MFPGNSKSSGGLFGGNNNQPQQNKPPGGGLFGNSHQKQQNGLFSGPSQTSLFGSATPCQKKPAINNQIPIYGTVDSIGVSHVHKNLNGAEYTSITGTIENYTLEELRMKDHFNAKNNQLPFGKQMKVNAAIATNIHERDQRSIRNQSPPQKAPGGLFGKPQPAPQTIDSRNPLCNVSFGNPGSFFANAQTTSSTNMFGGSANQTQTNAALNKQNTQTNELPKTPRDMFGSTQVTSMFGGPRKPVQTNTQAHNSQNPQSNQAQKPSGGMFGTSKNMFGGSVQPAQTNTPQNKQNTQTNEVSKQSGNMFGSASTNMFGGSAKQNQTNAGPNRQVHEGPSTSRSFFGNAVAGPGPFGSYPEPAQTNIAQNNQNPPANRTQKSPGGMFAASSNMFGGSAKQAQNNQAPNSHLFPSSQGTQPKEIVAEKQESPRQPVQEITNVKPKEETSRDERRIERPSNTGFAYEMNKMVLTSNFVELLQRHGVSVPGDLLESTDFMPQLFNFLRQFNMNLPTVNIPQFQLNGLARTNASETASSKSSSTPGRRRNLQEEEEDKKFEEEKPRKSAQKGLKKEEEKVEEEEFLVKAVENKRPRSRAESPLNLIKEEEPGQDEEEKIGVRDKKGKLQKGQPKDEDVAKEQGEDEDEDPARGIVSFYSGDEDSNDEGGTVDILKNL